MQKIDKTNQHKPNFSSLCWCCSKNVTSVCLLFSLNIHLRQQCIIRKLRLKLATHIHVWSSMFRSRRSCRLITGGGWPRRDGLMVLWLKLAAHLLCTILEIKLLKSCQRSPESQETIWIFSIYRWGQTFIATAHVRKVLKIVVYRVKWRHKLRNL